MGRGEALFDPLHQGRPVEPVWIPVPVRQLLQGRLAAGRTVRELLLARKHDAVAAQVPGRGSCRVLDCRPGLLQDGLRFIDLVRYQAAGAQHRGTGGIAPGPLRRPARGRPRSDRGSAGSPPHWFRPPAMSCRACDAPSWPAGFRQFARVAGGTRQGCLRELARPRLA